MLPLHPREPRGKLVAAQAVGAASVPPLVRPTQATLSSRVRASSSSRPMRRRTRSARVAGSACSAPPGRRRSREPAPARKTGYPRRSRRCAGGRPGERAAQPLGDQRVQLPVAIGCTVSRSSPSGRSSFSQSAAVPSPGRQRSVTSTRTGPAGGGPRTRWLCGWSCPAIGHHRWRSAPASPHQFVQYRYESRCHHALVGGWSVRSRPQQDPVERQPLQRGSRSNQPGPISRSGRPARRTPSPIPPGRHGRSAPGNPAGGPGPAPTATTSSCRSRPHPRWPGRPAERNPEIQQPADRRTDPG